MIALIRRVQSSRDLSFLLVEHDMRVIMEISESIVVLDFGRKIAEGGPRDVQSNSAVVAAYLGTPAI
ncbi:MAG: hypothetical protein AB7L76_02495 [Burkholderiaceae bacterium]